MSNATDPLVGGAAGLVLGMIVPAMFGWIAGTIAGRMLGDDGVDFFRLTREEQGAAYGIVFAGLGVLAGIGVLVGGSAPLGPEAREDMRGRREDHATLSVDEPPEGVLGLGQDLLDALFFEHDAQDGQPSTEVGLDHGAHVGEAGGPGAGDELQPLHPGSPKR